MLSWLAGPIAKAVIGIFGDSILKPLLDAWAKKQDINLEKYKTATDAEKSAALAAIGFEVTKVSAQRDIVLAAMSHPVWWWAWGLFVFPVGLYHAAIFLLSVAGVGPETFAVLRVPPTQEAWAKDIIQTIFIAQAGTGAVASISQGLSKAVRGGR